MSAITSAGSGNWSATGTWTGGVVPVEGDTATVALGHTVTVDQNITIGSDSGNALTINGTFDVPYNIASSYSLTLKGNITFGSGGEFKIGSSSNRLAGDKTYTININYSASLAARKYSFTVPSNGKLSWYGETRTTDTTHTGVTAGTDPTMTVASAIGWQIGDIIVLVDETDRTKTEEFTIKNTYTPESTTVPISGTLSNTKTTGWHVFNMSSNVMVKNYNNTYPSYVELLGTGSNQNIVSSVMFHTLGDSTKSGLILNRSVLDNSGNNIVILSYKGYKVQFANSVGSDSADIIQSFSDQSVAVQLNNNIIVNKINSINPVSDHITGLNIVYSTITTLNMYGGADDGFAPNSICYMLINQVNAYSVGSGVSNKYAILPTACNSLNIGTATCKYGTYGISNTLAGNVFIKSLICSNNSSSDVRNAATSGAGGNLYVEYCQLDSTTPITYSTEGGKLCVGNYNGTTGDSRTYYSSNIMQSEPTTYRTTSPSLKCAINNTTKTIFPLGGLARTVYVTSGMTITLACYSRKSASSTGAVAKLRIAKGTDGHGLSETTEYDILPASTDTWTSQSINLGTTTSAGFIDIELVVAKGGTAWNLYLDDLTITES